MIHYREADVAPGKNKLDTPDLDGQLSTAYTDTVHAHKNMLK